MASLIAKFSRFKLVPVAEYVFFLVLLYINAEDRLSYEVIF